MTLEIAVSTIKDIFKTGAAVFAGAWALYTFRGQLQSLLGWFNKPKLIIGILPFKSERIGDFDLGEWVDSDEFHFKPKYFSKNTDFHAETTVLNDADATRVAPQNKNGLYEFPIIFFNRGNQDFPGYNLTITFSPIPTEQDKGNPIRIVAVETETASIAGLYADHKTYKGKKGRELIPDSKIYRRYADLKLTADMLFLKGDIESRVYEMFFLTLKVPDGVARFKICYKIEHPSFYKFQRFVQAVRISSV
jgi:hypothetical protein